MKDTNKRAHRNLIRKFQHLERFTQKVNHKNINVCENSKMALHDSFELLLETGIWHHAYCVFTYIHALVIEINFCECQKVLNLYISSRDLLISSVRVPLLFLFLCDPYFSTFLSMWWSF
jgi:hypothetical protein